MIADNMEIDELILYSFPYPVSIDYNRLLTTQDKREQTHLALNIFAFSIRAITMALLVRYLGSENVKVNSQKLNEKIRARLPVALDHDWIEFLRLILETYHDHDARNEFFMPELYDLYAISREDQAASSIWETLERLARLSTSGTANKTNPEQIADELHELLRAMFKDLSFLATYEIWKVIEVDEREGYLYYERFQGIDPILQNVVPFGEVNDVNPRAIKPGTYYISDGQGRLLQLDPLVITHRFLDYDGTTSFIGLLNRLITDERSAILAIEYLLFAAEIRMRTSRQTADDDLLAKLNYLYGNLLNKKMEGLRTTRSVTWDSLREELRKHNAGSLKLIQQKYKEDYYVERDAITRVVDEFIEDEQYIALVITGDAGVGKTNLLYHLHNTLFSNESHYATLWLDGSHTNLQTKDGLHANSVIYWLIHRILEQLNWKEHFNLTSVPTNAQELEQMLGSVFQEFFLGSRKLIILIDSINENGKPYDALTQVAEFINRFFRYSIKLILTSRPHIWKHFRETYSDVYNQVHFYGAGGLLTKDISGISIENDSFILKRFTETEMHEAFDRYANYFDLQEAVYDSLTNDNLRNMLFDPLHLRFFCEANKGQRIRDDYEPSQIIPDLIAGMIRDKRLEPEYVSQFLVKDIVPLFVSPDGEPVNELSSTTLSMISRDGFSLRDYIVGEARFTSGERLNAPFISLKRAGLVYEIGTASNFKLKFHYEYFYDYFIGEYLIERSKQQQNKFNEIERLMTFLDKKEPFLWGPLKHLLGSLLADGEVEILDRLAETESSIQADLLTSVITESFSREHRVLRPLISGWLESSSENRLKAQVAVTVAVAVNDRKLLINAVTHRDANVRALAIQRIYDLWESDRETALLCLRALADSVRLYKLARNADFIETLIIGTVTIITLDYHNHGYDESTLRTMQEIVKPVIQRLFWLVPSRRLRRFALRIIVGRALVILQKAEGKGQTVISVKDASAFFPASQEDREIMLRLIDQIDAAANSEVESLETLLPFLKQLVATKTSYIISLVGGLIVMLAHFFRDYEETVQAIEELFEVIKDVYPETKDAKNPTVAPWAFMLNWTMGNAPYKEMSIEVADRVLSAYKEICMVIEDVYWSTPKLEYRDIDHPPMRVSVVGDPIGWAYYLKLEWRYDLVKRAIDLAIHRKDWDQIRRYIFHMTEVGPYHQIWEAGLDAMQDMIQLVRSHEKTRINTDILTREFWDELGRQLTWAYATQPKLLRVFAHRLGEDAPPEFHQQIKAMQPREDAMLKLVFGALLFGRQAMRDTESPVLRDFVRYILTQLVEAKNLQQFGTDVIVRLSNTVYDGTLFAERKNHSVDYSSGSE